MESISRVETLEVVGEVMNPESERPARDTRRKSLADIVFVKVPVSGSWFYNLVEAGIEVAVRSAPECQALEEKHAAAAVEIGRDPFRLSEEESGEEKRADSGTPVNGRDGFWEVNCSAIRFDLESSGYVLANVHVLQKGEPSNRCGTLVLPFFRKIEKEIIPSCRLNEVIDWILEEGCFDQCIVYRNPDWTDTANLRKRIKNDRKTNPLHFFPDGGYSCA